MNPKEFAKEIPSWRTSGSQDAASALDPREIRNELGSSPTAPQIKKWLVGGQEPDDFEGSLEFPEDASEPQKKTLLEAWADGWAAYAESFMRADLEERAQERLFYEGEHGMRDVGWYVSPPEGKVRGPFLTEKAALKEAIRTVEEEN